MLIYNVTVQVEKQIAAQWLLWLQQEHIPEVLGTGCFSKHQVLKLVDTDETDSVTYAVQYFSDSMELIEAYLNNHADVFRKKGFERWGNRYVAFRTIMEVVN
jgi:Domain of unknown function (DUF4286)